MKGLLKKILLPAAFMSLPLLSACLVPVPPGVAYVAVAPPAPLVEVRAVSPGPGYVWIEGSWVWRANAYQWRAGRWERRPHAEAVWVAGSWRHAHQGWYWVDGHWADRRG
ncbi:MAG TPA: YXWGXW repeat-containing protein [Thermoanaerobaculia bacterium]|nr:YXWGXW repeat-containing protein [Thermoanaerobaculia bacterium]